MRKMFLLSLFITILISVGCRPEANTATQTSMEAETVDSTDTPSPEATSTKPLERTPIPAETLTPAPSETAIPSPSPTSISPAISSENGRQLAFVDRIGDGAVQSIALAPDSSRLVVLTSTR